MAGEEVSIADVLMVTELDMLQILVCSSEVLFWKPYFFRNVQHIYLLLVLSSL